MALKLVDTHTHLCDAVFDADRGDVLERARQAGIYAAIAVSETLADAQRNVELAQTHPMIQPAAGLYPTYLDLQKAEAVLAFIRRERPNLCAIGEVGLDHWKVKEAADKERQREIFRQFIDLSRELELPLNVHSRSAGRHAIALLLECDAQKVQMHAFDGKASTALPGVDAGYFFSIPPSIVRSRQKQKLVKRLPLSCLLVETDSPVLAPNPNERNEPANVVIAIEAIAEIKHVSMEEVIEAVIENTSRLYGALNYRKGDQQA
jgi:TatD DNase family protein